MAIESTDEINLVDDVNVDGVSASEQTRKLQRNGVKTKDVMV